jgi:hypothetical protein
MQQLTSKLKSGEEKSRSEAYEKITDALRDPAVMGDDFVDTLAFANFPSAVAARNKLMKAKRLANPARPTTVGPSQLRHSGYKRIFAVCGVPVVDQCIDFPGNAERMVAR